MLYIGVFIKSDPSAEKAAVPMLKDIMLSNNRFINFPGVLSHVSSAENVVFKDNVIINDVPYTINRDRRGDITVDGSSNVFILGNRWEASPFVSSPKLRIENTPVSKVYSVGNRFVKQP